MRMSHIGYKRDGLNGKRHRGYLYCKVPTKLKGKFYRTTIHLATLCGSECQRDNIMRILVAVEIRMLKWMCGPTRKDRIQNDFTQEKIGVALIE